MQLPAAVARTGHRLALNAAALALGGFVAQLCFLAVEGLVARRLGRHDYGLFSSAYALAMAALPLVELGMGHYVIQEGARSGARVPMLLGTSLVLKLLAAALVYPALLAVLPMVGYAPGFAGIFAVVFWYAALLALQESLAAVSSAQQRMYVNAAFQAATPLLLLAFVGATVALHVPVDLVLVSGAYVGAAAAVTLLWLLWIASGLRLRVVPARAAEIARGSAFYGLSSLLYQASYRIDVLLLSLLRPLAEAGLFAAADKIMDLGLKTAVMLHRVVAPELFARSTHDRPGYERACELLIRSSALAGAGLGLAVALGAEPLVRLVFGPSFAPAARVLELLAASLAVRFPAFSLQTVSSTSGRQGRRTLALGVGVAASASLNLAVIPAFGATGAAVGRLAGDLVQVGLLLAGLAPSVARRRLLGWALLPLCCALAAFAAARWSFGGGAAALPVGLGLYAVAVLAGGVVSPGELRRALRPGNQ